MAGTDIHQTDSTHANDRTYYGNGAKSSEYPPGENGSLVAGSTNLTLSFDGETQRNGVYYRYMAATSGSGVEVSALNANAPDTFCPLGWQMPYGGTGGDYYNKSRSWIYLFNTYGYTGDLDSAEKVKSYPVSYVMGGYYNWGSTGRVFSLDAYGPYWTMTVNSANNAWRYDIAPTAIHGFNGQAGTKSDGFTVR